MSVEVRIRRLVLEGVDPEQVRPAALGAAIERELARLVAAGGATAERGEGSERKRDARDGHTAGRDAAGEAARQVAAVVYARLPRGASGR